MLKKTVKELAELILELRKRHQQEAREGRSSMAFMQNLASLGLNREQTQLYLDSYLLFKEYRQKDIAASELGTASFYSEIGAFLSYMEANIQAAYAHIDQHLDPKVVQMRKRA